VLLIEADMRRPAIASRIGVEPGAGLVDALGDGVLLGDVVSSVSLGDQGGRMDVLCAGVSAGNGSAGKSPLALLASDRMGELIAAAEDSYDLVVIDTPPTAVVSDAIPLVKHVSGVLVVTRIGKNTRQSALHLREQLHNLHAHTLGIVINGADAADAYHTTVSTYLHS
jgi:Mrp family chromosome partitioning ATPase